MGGRIESLDEDLIAFWNMEEISGSRFDYSSPSGIVLADNATVTQAAGLVGYAAQFVRANSEFLSATVTDIQNTALQLGSRDIGISCKVWFDTIPAAGVSYTWVSGAGADYFLEYGGTGRSFQFGYVDAGGITRNIETTSRFDQPVVGRWYHVLVDFTFSTLTLRMWVKDTVTGALIALAEVQTQPPRTPNVGTFSVGRRGAATHHHDGRIDAVGLWSRPFTDAEVDYLLTDIQHPFPAPPDSWAYIKDALLQMTDGARFWTDDEALLGFREALRIWNMLTGTWRSRESFAVSADARWVSLPAPLSFGARIEHDSVPLHQGSIFSLDQGRPLWEIENSADSGAPSSPAVWAPAGASLIALWPARASGSGTLQVDGLRATPVPAGEDAEVVQLTQAELQACLGYTLHYLSFKEGGARWAALQSQQRNFYRSAAEKNDRLLQSAFFRRMMGLDLDKFQRPIGSVGGIGGREVQRGQ